MNWQKMANENVIFLDAEPAANLIVEIFQGRINFTVSCHKNDIRQVGPRIFKSLPVAKRYGEKWFKKELNILVDALDKVLKDIK